MRALLDGIWSLKLRTDTRGQDLIDYALLAGFALVMAAAMSPSVAGGISTIFTKLWTAMSSASTRGSAI